MKRFAIQPKGLRNAIAASGVRMAQDTPVQRFIKDAIRVGTYVHPLDKWKLSVDVDRLKKWAEAFDRMRTNGVKVPFVRDHKVDSQSTLSYIDELYVEGDELVFSLAIHGQDAIDEVRRVNQVSVFVERNVRDGVGNVYDEAVTHIALTPEPVVPGQKDFIPLAASRGQTGEGNFPLLFSATEVESKPMALTREQLKKLKDKLQITQELVEETLVDQLTERLDQIIEEHNKKLQAKADEVAALKTQLEDSKKSELSVEELDSRAEDVEERIEGLKKAGVAPALAASLSGLLTGPADARDGYMLSRVTTSDGKKPIRAVQIVKTIEEILKSKLDLGSKTGVQNGRIAMSRSASDVDPELTKRMTEAANNSAASSGFAY